jgi:hypothetical protein
MKRKEERQIGGGHGEDKERNEDFLRNKRNKREVL